MNSTFVPSGSVGTHVGAGYGWRQCWQALIWVQTVVVAAVGREWDVRLSLTLPMPAGRWPVDLRPQKEARTPLSLHCAPAPSFP